MKTIPLILVLILLCGNSARAQISVLGGLSFDREARPGDRYAGSFVIKNDTDQPQEAKIYQNDYSFSCDGTNRYDPPGKHPRSNARWIDFSSQQVLVPAHASVTIHYTVTVPADSTSAALTGSYWSMMMVEALPPGAPGSTLQKPDTASRGISQIIRYGIQIATHLANTGRKAVRFIDARLVKNDEEVRVLQVDLENSGDLFYRPEVYVELFDGAGASRGKIEGVRYRMYPGSSVRQSLKLGSISAGTYKAMVVVDAGGPDVFGAQYTLQF